MMPRWQTDIPRRRSSKSVADKNSHISAQSTYSCTCTQFHANLVTAITQLCPTPPWDLFFLYHLNPSYFLGNLSSSLFFFFFPGTFITSILTPQWMGYKIKNIKHTHTHKKRGNSTIGVTEKIIFIEFFFLETNLNLESAKMSKNIN